MGCNDYEICTVERLKDGKIFKSVQVAFDEDVFSKLDSGDSSSSDEESDNSLTDASEDGQSTEVFDYRSASDAGENVNGDAKVEIYCSTRVTKRAGKVWC